jgi:hypothetical protein
MTDVIKAIKSKPKWETMYVSYEHGVLASELDRPVGITGEKSIGVTIGKYRNFLEVYVGVLWGFDESSHEYGSGAMNSMSDDSFVAVGSKIHQSMYSKAPQDVPDLARKYYINEDVIRLADKLIEISGV